MRPFDTLTRRGQTERLRQLALAALPAWPLAIHRVRHLNDGFNRIFRLDADAPDGPARAVVRVHRPRYRGLDQIGHELRWMEAVARDTELTVPRPLRTRDGALLTVAAHPGVPEPRPISVLSWVAGRQLAHALVPEHLHTLGAATAVLHAHGRAHHDDIGVRVLDQLFEHHPTLYDDGPPVPKPRRALFRAAVARAEARLAALRASDRPAHLCHCDLHPYNVLVASRGAGATLAIVDFDDCAITWPAYDIGIAFYYVRCLAPDAYASLLAAFRAGYETVAAWPTDDAELDDLVIARQVVLLNHLSRETDPQHRAAYPDYLTKVEGRLEAWLR